MVFGQKGATQPVRGRRLDVLLRTIGNEGDIAARAQERAMSIHRLLINFGNAVRERRDDKRILTRIETSNDDVTSLMESLRFISERMTFLLDATLGTISNEQNQIIKLVSVSGVHGHKARQRRTKPFGRERNPHARSG
jgi:magnesium transporter